MGKNISYAKLALKIIIKGRSAKHILQIFVGWKMSVDNDNLNFSYWYLNDEPIIRQRSISSAEASKA